MSRAASAIAIAIATALATPASAQGPAARPIVADGASLRVSILTFGPGDAVWERFGHNAIRIQDATTGRDVAYNWGLFSFDEPNFIPRFLAGDTQYWVAAIPTAQLLDEYVRRDRESVEQDLALTSPQRAALAAFVAENVREENKYYRYDYFLDNCSTRVRDALDVVLGGALERRFSVLSTTLSYRDETVRLLTPDPLPQAGTDFALGPRADRRITAWEAMFVPMRLRDYLREVTVASASGGPVPLVSGERVLHTAQRRPEPAEARGIALGAWGPILGVWMLVLVPLGPAARRRTRIPAALMGALWYGVTGLLGLVLLGMWLGSAHTFWYENLNLLLVSPLGLVAAVPVMRGFLRGAIAPWVRWLVIAIVAQSLLALLLSAFVAQHLGGPLLLVLPAHLGLAIAFWWHLRSSPATNRTAEAV